AHSDPHENRPVFHPPLMAHLYHQRIQVDDRVDGLQRPALPSPHLFYHRVGHLADQRRAHFHAVHLFQMTLDIPRCHPTRIHGQNLLIETRESSFMFGDDLRIVGSVAIPWHFDLHRTEITLNLFPALAVAVVAPAASFRGVLF